MRRQADRVDRTFVWVPVPPVRFGGTEQVVDELAREPVSWSLSVTTSCFTVAESTCPVPRAWYFDKSAEPLGTTVAESAHMLAAYQSLSDLDVIHDHTILGPLVPADCPALRRSWPPWSVHGGVTRDLPGGSQDGSSGGYLGLSAGQRPGDPDRTVIHHSIDLQRYVHGAGEADYLLFVGRMSPDKGLHRAIRKGRRGLVRVREAA